MTGPNPYGRTALQLAVIAGDPAAVRLAIEAGNDLDAHESFSYTALHFAVEEGLVEIAAALLEAGADVESRTSIGVTPLKLATLRWKKCPEGSLITLLKVHGASGWTQDGNGYTVIEMARALFRFPPELMELLVA